MPNVYQQFPAQLDALQNVAFNSHAAAVSMQSVPGGQVMLNHRPMNFTQLFRALVIDYQVLWTWNPGPRTPSSGEVLDGEADYGQCASLARALHLLARSPSPYGLALGASTVTTVCYRGAHSNGFISRHEGTHYGLGPNVLRPGTLGNPEFEDLYYWSNHWVVKYLGRHHDPSYSKPGDSTEYTDLNEMAVYEILPGDIPHDGAMWEKAKPFGGSPVYFKLLNNVVVGNRRVPVEGPFAELP